MALRFDTKMFAGRKGNIRDIVDTYTNEGTFAHLHLGVYQGNTYLGECARQCIVDSGRPVLYARAGSRSQLLPAEALPDPDIGRLPYRVDGNEIHVRLDRMPFMYFPRSAHQSTVGRSQEFMQSFLDLRENLQIDVEGKDFPHRILTLARAPDIMNAAGLSAFSRQDRVWLRVIRQHMAKVGIQMPEYGYGPRMMYSLCGECLD